LATEANEQEQTAVDYLEHAVEDLKQAGQEGGEEVRSAIDSAINRTREALEDLRSAAEERAEKIRTRAEDRAAEWQRTLEDATEDTRRELCIDGEILKVLGEQGAPPYLVRWEDGHEAEVFPGSDMYVQHLKGVEPD
ncbi:MAG: DUF1918 domain-containing protein, partial [Solirubrobacterales bacterium]